ncbi:MAG: hypothetical protein QNK04_13455 [Myxococcota bacterium]|nr:hypothetical protein [Myxococcota bacterium]
MRAFDPQRHSSLTRVERAASRRRERARAHLDKMRRRQQLQRPAPVLQLAAVLLLASLSTGAWAGAAWRRDARIDSLAVQGLRHLEAGEIAALAPGQPLSGREADALAELVAEHPWIETARVLPLPSGRALVAVVEREPAAVLRGSPAWAVDANGVPFAQVAQADLPGLPRLVASEASLGEPSTDLAGAVALARRLPELGLPEPSEIAVSAPDEAEGYSLRLAGLRPQIVLGRDEIDTRLADLAQLLEAARPELERAERVDLRFRDQAVLDVSPPQEGAAQAATTSGGPSSSNRQPAG